ncbi:ras-like protein RAS2 [Saccoglossus kowalevskii]
MLCRGASYKPYNREVEQEHLRTGSLPWLEDLQLNVVLLGPKHVGKTSLTTAFTHGVYHNLDFDPHEFIYETRELVDNEIAQLKILDTRTGDENNFCLEDMATTLQVGEGFIIVYSITDRGQL